MSTFFIIMSNTAPLRMNLRPAPPSALCGGPDPRLHGDAPTPPQAANCQDQSHRLPPSSCVLLALSPRASLPLKCMGSGSSRTPSRSLCPIQSSLTAGGRSCTGPLPPASLAALCQLTSSRLSGFSALNCAHGIICPERCLAPSLICSQTSEGSLLHSE